jgi:phosphate acetyltransferase
MDILEQAFAAARRNPARVLLPEIDEPRVAEAAAQLAAQGLAEPLTLAHARPAGAYVDLLLRQRPGLKPALARRMLEKPLIRAAAMVAAGEAEALVAGATHPTRRVIEAAALAIGMEDGVATPSSFFVMRLPGGRSLIFADCAVNVAPDAAQLADIARASAASARALLGTARLAMLSFSTGASGSGASVTRVRAAVDILRAEALDALGPVQADAALNPAIAAKKGLEPAEPANVLIFPDLDSGNIGYKLVQELAGAQAIGPFLQGFARPVCDLSRGATAADIVAATVLTLARA